jgi:uncharacterized repeat protein (TIGR01451 family)
MGDCYASSKEIVMRGTVSAVARYLKIGRMCAASIAGVLVCGASSAAGQLVVANTGSANGEVTAFRMDLSGAQPTRSLLVGEPVTAMAADDSTGRLYFTSGFNLKYAAYTPSGLLSVVEVGSFFEGPSLRNVTSLAYDSVDGVLVGRTAEGLVVIDRNTAQTTTVFAATGQDFAGMDFDPGTNAFYATNTTLASTLLPQGRGIYRINKPLTSPTFTRLAAFPNSTFDVEGAAVGNGRMYLVYDRGTRPIQVFNLATGGYEAPIPSPLNSQSTLMNAAATWTQGLFPPPPSPDLSITLTDAPDPLLLETGQPITLSFGVSNLLTGAAANTTVTFPIPPGTTLLSASRPFTINEGTATFAIGTLGAVSSQTFTAQLLPSVIGSVATQATVSTTSNEANLANNVASTSTRVRAREANLRNLFVEAPFDCQVLVGNVSTYRVLVDNLGPEEAVAAFLTATIPVGMTLVDSTPSGTLQGNQLTIALGNMAPIAQRQITLRLRPTVPARLTVSVDSTSETVDPEPSDVATSTAWVALPTPTTAAIRCIVSSISTSPSSLVPGRPGDRVTDINELAGSPSGERWLVLGQILESSSQLSRACLFVGNDTTFQLGVMGGVTLIPGQVPGQSAPFLRFNYPQAAGINDAGEYAFGGIDSGPTSVNGFVATVGASGLLSVVAREGGSVPFYGPGWGYTDDLRPVSMLADGSAAFGALMVTPIDNRKVLLSRNGAVKLAEQFADTPVPLEGDEPFRYNDLQEVGVAEDGSWGALSMIASPFQSTAWVVDGDVRIRSELPLPSGSIPGPVQRTNGAFWMEPHGSWFAKGDTQPASSAPVAWLVRNGVVIAAQGSPIFEGASDVWERGFDAASNRRGDVIVSGSFLRPDGSRVYCIVLNNQSIIAQTDDAVDLDANGLFDDNVYLRDVRPRSMIFSDDGDVTFFATLQTQVGPLCGGQTRVVVGRGILRVRAPLATQSCDYDYNQDENVDLTDAQQMAQVFVGLLTPEANWLDGDLNGDENSDLTDAQILAAYVVTGNCGV